MLAEQNSRLNAQKADLENYQHHLEELVESRTSALRESETKFRSIYENANDAIFIMKDDVFVDCNHKTAELFGCRKDQIIGSTPYSFSPPSQPDGRDSREKAFEKIQATLNGDPQRFEWKHHKLDGRQFDAEVSLSSLNMDGQQFLLAIVRDISSRKKSEEALRASEKNFRNIFDKTKHGILIFDKDLKILAANKAVIEMTGYALDDNSLLYATDFISNDQHFLLKERLTRLMRQDILVPHEYKVKLKNGQIHIVEAESSLMDYYGQEVFLVMLRDVTFMREAEKRLMEAIIRTEENERSRIAQDLHDGLGPVLSTVKLYFQVYQDARDEAKKELITEKLKTTIDEAIKRVSNS
jgi:PAS domain S-box-containing protein